MLSKKMLLISAAITAALVGAAKLTMVYHRYSAKKLAEKDAKRLSAERYEMAEKAHDLDARNTVDEF